MEAPAIMITETFVRVDPHREAALRLAIEQCAHHESAREMVERAQVFLDFLTGGAPPATAASKAHPMLGLKELSEFGSLEDWWAYVLREAESNTDLKAFLASPEGYQFSLVAPQSSPGG